MVNWFLIIDQEIYPQILLIVFFFFRYPDIWVWNTFISTDELLAKGLQGFETDLSVSNNLYRKLVSSLDSLIMLDDNIKVSSVSFFIANLNLSS